jgi:hypothetical protein
LVAVQFPTSGPAQATPTDGTIFVAAANVVPANDFLYGSESGSFSSDGGEFESPFSWTEESSDEGLDYFVALDVAAAESSPRLETGEALDPPTGARIESCRRKVVAKHSAGESSRSGRHRRMGLERTRLCIDRGGQRDLLSSSFGASIGEGDLRNLFEGEELKMMLFNYREASIIPLSRCSMCDARTCRAVVEGAIVFICAVGLVTLRCVYVIYDLYCNVACCPSLASVML